MNKVARITKWESLSVHYTFTRCVIVLQDKPWSTQTLEWPNSVRTHLFTWAEHRALVNIYEKQYMIDQFYCTYNRVCKCLISETTSSYVYYMYVLNLRTIALSDVLQSISWWTETLLCMVDNSTALWTSMVSGAHFKSWRDNGYR